MNYIIIKYDLGEYTPRFEILQEISFTSALKILFNEIDNAIHYDESAIISLSEIEHNQKWSINSDCNAFPTNAQPLFVWSLDETPFDCMYDEYKPIK